MRGTRSVQIGGPGQVGNRNSLAVLHFSEIVSSVCMIAAFFVIYRKIRHVYVCGLV